MRDHYESRDAVDGCAHERALHKNGLRRLPERVRRSRAARQGWTLPSPGRPRCWPADRWRRILCRGGAFYDAPNDPDESKLIAGLKFTKKTATVMTYAQYFRREAVCTVCT